MKKISKIILLFILSLSITSCLVDDNDPTASFGQGPNVAGFANSNMTIAGVTNGNEYSFNIPVEVKGPTSSTYSNDITINISVDPSSTAVEGTNFTLNTKTIVLKSSDNYKAVLPIKLLTNGITAPLDESPILKLVVSSANGVDNLVPNGTKLTVILNYLCFSNLAGEYDVAYRYVNSAAGIDTSSTFTDTLTEVADGEYRTGRVGHWSPDLLGGTPGMTILDVCNEITIPYQNLVDLYSNIVEGVPGQSSVDPVTGIITLEYTICTDSGCREYYVTYTPK